MPGRSKTLRSVFLNMEKTNPSLPSFSFQSLNRRGKIFESLFERMEKTMAREPVDYNQTKTRKSRKKGKNYKYLVLFEV